MELVQYHVADEASTEHTGIACFTVRHKDPQGEWVENDEAAKKSK
jgi:hypothetical protein